MKIDVNVHNLGRLEEGVVKIRPVTLLVGENGTGKSFFTKFLYSVLNVINRNVYHIDLIFHIESCVLNISTFDNQLTYNGLNDQLEIKKLLSSLHKIRNEVTSAAEQKLESYLSIAVLQATHVEQAIASFEVYLTSLDNTPSKKSSVSRTSEAVINSLRVFEEKLSGGMNSYSNSLAQHFKSELKDNFQISDLSQLILFDKDYLKISIGEVGSIDIHKNENSSISFTLDQKFIDSISSLSRVVFFESPAYWKVRDALVSAKNRQLSFFWDSSQNENLTGVPKYFYDLNTSLNENSKSEKNSDIKVVTKELESALGGEFIFQNEKLSFKETGSGREISKNLISFGMTNLGMIHSLLKKNLIAPGSFVFIDEPETNLHPKWQILLMSVLIRLAENNINVVIATHSVDMLKALEVGLKKRGHSSDDFVATHYFDTDGRLMKFESGDPVQQVAEARQELSASYEELFYSENL